MWELSRKFKFLLVGVSNTLVDLAVLNLLLWVGWLGVGPTIVSFLVANLNSFILNRNFTFADRPRNQVYRQYLQFIVLSIVGAAINALIYWQFNRLNLLPDQPFWRVNLGKLVATGLVIIWNYWSADRFVFAPAKQRSN